MTTHETFILLPIKKAEDGTFGLVGIDVSADLKDQEQFVLSVLRFATFLFEKNLYEKAMSNV